MSATSSSMQAILCHGEGDSAVMCLGRAPLPTCGAGQIRIRVRASGVNRADILQRQGHYPPPPGESPLLGLEVAGEVLETGATTTRFKVGDRVMALLAGGGYAEQVTVDEQLVLPLPDELAWTEGAAIPEVFITAHHNLFTLGGAGSGCQVLIHAGASGVGTAGIQLLRGIASQVFVTVGSEDKAEACEQLGAVAIRYKQEDFAARVAQLTGKRGVDIILDPIGGKYLAANLAALAIDGRLILIGLMGGKAASIDLATLLGKRARLIGSTLRNLPQARKAAAVASFSDHGLSRLAAGKLRPIVDRVYAASEVAKAHTRMEENANIGKLILVWD